VVQVLVVARRCHGPRLRLRALCYAARKPPGGKMRTCPAPAAQRKQESDLSGCGLPCRAIRRLRIGVRAGWGYGKSALSKWAG
jgi:hypothetical protein